MSGRVTAVSYKLSKMKTAGGPLPLDAKAFGISKAKVELLQTHIGWIYLVGEYAFKLKKPVKYDFLDFTSLEKRRWACEREVELNSRLCPDLYLGVRPVVKYLRALRVVPHAKSPGAVVDWAVCMKRLPKERMLDALLKDGAVSVEDARRIAETLAEFYARQRGKIAPGGLGDLEAVKNNVAENIREGRAMPPEIVEPETIDVIEARGLSFLDGHAEVFKQRARAGFVVDGHGDLRSENICLPLAGPPLPFDCIEFNDRFRICDSAMDIAFLAMDFDSHGRADLSAAFVERYKECFDKDLPPRLLQFYMGYRAFVKAKVAAWIAADKKIAAAQRNSSLAGARTLFDLSLRYSLNGRRIAVVFCGPPGSGKSTLAAEFSRRLNFKRLSTDAIRDEIVPRDAPREVRYSKEALARVYAALTERAGAALASGKSVVLDATFGRKASREAIAAIARSAGAVPILIYADCPPEKIAAHVKTREAAREAYGSEADEAVAKRLYKSFEIPRNGERFASVCRVSTAGTAETSRCEAWRVFLQAVLHSIR